MGLQVPESCNYNCQTTDIFFFFYFQGKYVLTFYVNYLLKCQALIYMKNKIKLECHLLQIFLGALRVKALCIS